MVVLDAMEKMAGVRVLQTELNDRPGVCLKLLGSLGDVQAAAAAAEAAASAMQVEVIAHVIPSPSPWARRPTKPPPISIRFSSKPPCSTRRRI